MRKIDPSEYMVDGWDQQGTPTYKRGSLHNKVGMWIMWTSIFYLNTNNGWTQFKKGGKVKCVENRLVTFDSNLEHAGVTCTDQKRKVVINFNYER